MGEVLTYLVTLRNYPAQAKGTNSLERCSGFSALPPRPCWRVGSAEASVPMRVEQSDANPLAGSQWFHEFTPVKQVSAGAYGFVWQCREKKTGDLVAIKFISRDRSKIDRNAEREIINHAMLVHPHIIEFKLCFLTDKYLAIAMEYAEGEDLLRYGCLGIATVVTIHARFMHCFASSGLVAQAG